MSDVYDRYEIGGAWIKRTSAGKKYLSVALKGRGWHKDGERPTGELLKETGGNFSIWPNDRKNAENHPDYRLVASVLRRETEDQQAMEPPAEEFHDDDIPF